MTEQLAPTAPTTSEEPETPEKRRIHKPKHYVLAWVTEANCDTDEAGEPISGTGDRCFVEMPLPAGIEGKLNSNKIKRAIKSAVYRDGCKEFGNRNLVILSYTEELRFDFVEETRTILREPIPGEELPQSGE